MKTKVSLPVIIATIFFLIFVVVVIAYTTLGPRSAATIPVPADQQASNAWLIQKAKECSGNFGSLEPADQQKAQELTKGKGAFVISMIYSHSK